jgi:branched-subunit amino acid ABC-type transport system permease component
LAYVLALAIDGALNGVVYVLIALSLVLVYRASAMMNFALGEWVVFAELLASLGALDLGLAAALALAGVTMIGLKLFPIVILGGLDSIAGTIVAAIAIGVLESLAGGYGDESFGSGFGGIAPYLVLLAVLLLRPQGLFGRPPARRV